MGQFRKIYGTPRRWKVRRVPVPVAVGRPSWTMFIAGLVSAWLVGRFWREAAEWLLPA